MAHNLIWHTEAKTELRNSVEYYERKRIGLGLRFFKIVQQKISLIQAYPERYKIILTEFRETIVGKPFPFTIVYLFNEPEDSIIIAAVYHNSRNPKNKFRK